MSIFLPTRPRAVRARQGFGRGAGSLFPGSVFSGSVFPAIVASAVVVCSALGCSDEDSDPAEQTGSVNAPDASVRDLPGEGLEPTPDFDTDTRQREPIGPQELVETIDEIRNGMGGQGNAPSAADAAAPADDADAGAN